MLIWRDFHPPDCTPFAGRTVWHPVYLQWYNYEHHHSGLKFLTPDQRRSGKSQEILEKRHQVYEAAKEKYPERWNGRATRDWSLPDIVYLNPETEADRLSSVGFWDRSLICMHLFWLIISHSGSDGSVHGCLHRRSCLPLIIPSGTE